MIPDIAGMRAELARLDAQLDQAERAVETEAVYALHRWIADGHIEGTNDRERREARILACENDRPYLEALDQRDKLRAEIAGLNAALETYYADLRERELAERERRVTYGIAGQAA